MMGRDHLVMPWAVQDSLIEQKAFLLFRRFFALKMGIPLIFEQGFTYWPEVSMVSLGAATAIIIASRHKGYFLGLLVLFLVSSSLVLASWPFTLNHVALETMVLLLLLL